MTYTKINETVAKLVKKHGERAPFNLCRTTGIELIFLAMGKESDAVKGFFLESKRIRIITIYNNLLEVIQRIIVAHELCHAANHHKSGIAAFHELTMFD